MPRWNTASAFVAGSLAQHARADVEEHVDVCPDCLALLAAIARVSSIGPEDAGAHGNVDEGSEAPGSLRKGSRVGRYELHALVGVGAMGVVYAARDPDLDRTVALKLVRASLGRDAKGDTERLLAEARTMAKLVHPNVVAVHDVGTHQGRVFLAMDHVDGETLGAWLGRGPRKTEDVIAAFSAAGRGLAAAHRAGIVHRDFKPENVLVGKDGRVLVTDFGLASAAAGPLEGAPAAIVSTPAYMAPEQLRGEPVDAAADHLSFCVGALRGDSW